MRRLFAVVALLAFLLAIGCFLWVFDWPVGPTQELFVEIAPGTPTRSIAEQLAQAGVIATPYGFEALKLVGGGSLKAGEYRFGHPSKVTEVYRRLVHGDVYTVALTIPEGANLFDIAARVEAAKLGSRDAFLRAASAQSSLVARMDPHAATLEGYLFPATYQFGRHATPEQMLRTMVRQFQGEALAMGITGDVHRLVTLASLVERETPIPSERPLVASVFENRLMRNMPLETDPSVIYAALLRGGYRGTIFQSDLQFDSPYNTYRHPGLPPGPICNPGVLSLRAVRHPAQTDYLYFVAAGADPLGHSRFAATLEQHRRNVATYRASLRIGNAEKVQGNRRR